MKLLMLNPMQGVGKEELGHIGDYEQMGLAKKCVELGHTVHIIKMNKNIISSFNGITYKHFDNLDDLDSYDYLFIQNFAPNIFGGVVIPRWVDSYKLMASFKKPICYMFSDLRLHLKQMWRMFANKDLSNFPGLCEKDVKITSDIIYVCQGYDDALNYKYSHKKGLYTEGLNVTKVLKYPYYFAPISLMDSKYFDINREYNPNREYDLYYGASSLRDGKRNEEFLDYFFNRDIRTAMYGSVKLEQFKMDFTGYKVPEINSKLKQTGVVDENKRGFATILMGDKDYRNNMITLRVYESLLADMVCFVDYKFDSNKVIFKDSEFLKDYLYVKSGKELETKIKELKNDSKLLHKVIEEQRKVMYNAFSQDKFKEQTRILLEQICK